MEKSLCAACAKAVHINPAALYHDQVKNASATAMTLSSLDVTTLPVDDWQDNFGEGQNFDYKRREDSDIDRRILDLGDRRVVSLPHMPELSTATAIACRFCQKIKSLLTERYSEYEEWLTPKIEFRIRYEWEEWESKYELEALTMLIDFPSREGKLVDVFKFTVAAWPGKCKDWLKIKSPPVDCDRSLSATNLQMIQSLLDKCDTGHKCHGKVIKSESLAPARLLEIQPGDDQIRLLDNVSSELATTRDEIRYATLSYCWGTSPTLKTTSRTLQQHCRGISVADLPAVLREAVAVVSWLGLRYLWIDALCILQDDKDDWERESGNMTKIYASSYITIAVASSSHCDESFLSRRSIDAMTIPFALPSDSQPDYQGEYTIVLNTQNVQDPQTDLQDSPWSKRAWVWQEQTMAARMLIFGKHMIHFRCHKHLVREDGAKAPTELDSKLDVDWWSIGISEYMSRGITYPSDRLSAVSGVAKVVEQNLHDAGTPTEYLAGLWKDRTFATQLLWSIDEPRHSYDEMMASLVDEEAYRAPSWSWASRNEYCTINNNLALGPVFSLVRYNLPPIRTDSTIAVKPGSSITLSGKMVAATSVVPQNAEDLPWGYGYHKFGHPLPDLGIVKYSLDWAQASPDRDQVERIKLFIVDHYKNWKTVHGLVLMPCEGEQVGVRYRRVGTFSVIGYYVWMVEEPDREVIII